MDWDYLVEISRKKMSRRKLIGGFASALPLMLFGSACSKHRYIRPAGELDLGTVRELLYSVVHVRSKAALVFRDADGWRVLSARCTYIGCDLTFQEPILLCPCCRSQFNMEGKVLGGSVARHDLPWLKPYYRDGHIYADPGNVVPANYHFTTPQIEEAIRVLRERIKEQGISDEVKIPEFLKGGGDGEVGRMFLEDDPNLLHELDMIK